MESRSSLPVVFTVLIRFDSRLLIGPLCFHTNTFWWTKPLECRMPTSYRFSIAFHTRHTCISDNGHAFLLLENHVSFLQVRKHVGCDAITAQKLSNLESMTPSFSPLLHGINKISVQLKTKNSMVNEIYTVANAVLHRNICTLIMPLDKEQMMHH